MVLYAEIMSFHGRNKHERKQVVLCARVEQVTWMMVALCAQVECEVVLVLVAESMKVKGTKLGLGLANAESETPCLCQHPANYWQWVYCASYDSHRVPEEACFCLGKG